MVEVLLHGESHWRGQHYYISDAKDVRGNIVTMVICKQIAMVHASTNFTILGTIVK